MLRKLRIFSHTTASADAIGDDIKTGMDRGNWIVLTNVDFETEAFWKYYQLCCSVNDSRVDSAFRLIILHKARSFYPMKWQKMYFTPLYLYLWHAGLCATSVQVDTQFLI